MPCYLVASWALTNSSSRPAVTLRLTGLIIYPIKAARGISLAESEVDEFGLRHDRRWMVVNPSGEFLSQRTHPRLALIAPEIEGQLSDHRTRDAALELQLRPMDTVSAVRSAVWGDICPASWLGENAAGWFSEFLGAARVAWCTWPIPWSGPRTLSLPLPVPG